MFTLNEDQITRYSRHILLKEVGLSGQEKLFGAKVLVIGTGGLGSPISLYLGAAGIGTIGIADMDRVDLSNLQRQIAHTTDSIGQLKVESAQKRINAINPEVKVIAINEKIDAKNIINIISEYDFILEATDNFTTKYLVNDAAILTDKAFNQGGILSFQGQTITHLPGTASYRCVYPQAPPENTSRGCSRTGVLGAVAGILGTIQATEAIKYILGIGDLLINRVLTFDALSMEFRTIPIKKTEWANMASENTKITDLLNYHKTLP
ncbi:MAG: HesA/MoeB/ThiF family protein [Spirochaetales bacterium]|nr:HesA/MoeB/ThiF family protein [Spirochaetales bacterium]